MKEEHEEEEEYVRLIEFECPYLYSLPFLPTINLQINKFTEIEFQVSFFVF